MSFVDWEPGRWPLGDGAPCDTAVAQELVDAWNASNIKPGTWADLDDVADGDSVWNFIQRVRQATWEASHIGDPPVNRKYADPATGYPLNMPSREYYNQDFHTQPFVKLYGAEIDKSWQELPDGTRADPYRWHAPVPLANVTPYIFLFNELKDIIELYKWPWEYADYEAREDEGSFYRGAFPNHEFTAQDIVDSAHAVMLAASIQPYGQDDFLVQCQGHLGYPGALNWYTLQMREARNCYSFTPPAGTQAVKIALAVTDDYYREAPGGGQVANPEWDVEVYIGTTVPAAWDYGALAATITAPGDVSRNSNNVQIVDLENWTANVKNYIQLRASGSVGVKPDYLATDGWWPETWYITTLQKSTSVPRILYRIVDE